MTDKEKIEFKNSLKATAFKILHEREHAAISAMNEAQLAANEEGKSSVGDKYETSRAMAQMDRDIHARQLESVQKEISFMQQVDVSLFLKQVEIGAFADAGGEKYFFLAGLGPVDINGNKIYFLSIHSPIGRVFEGKKAGEKVVFNGRQIDILDVY